MKLGNVFFVRRTKSDTIACTYGWTTPYQVPGTWVRESVTLPETVYLLGRCVGDWVGEFKTRHHIKLEITIRS